MTLNQLKYAIMIAETGTFIEAAKKLYISQSSLSFSIKGLEEELNQAIFVRSHKGTMLTDEGKEFVREAKEIVFHLEMLEEKFSRKEASKERFSVSTQHYTFVSAAFAELINQYKVAEYELTLNETKTLEVIEEVSRLRSELGIIHLSKANEPVICKILKENGLLFHGLFTTNPYILVGVDNPLAQKELIDLEDLTDYPCISFIQDDLTPLFFSEEVINILGQQRSIKISDKGALADLLEKTDAFVVSTGIYLLTGGTGKTVAIPLNTRGENDDIKVGLIRRQDSVISPACDAFCDILKKTVQSFALQSREKRYF
jgi:DNA-binding transcriptional LysR family regulator